MTRFAFLFLLTLVLGAPACAQAADTDTPSHPVLKPSAVVTGPVVTVGDLVANAGIIAKVPIFRAPDLGTTGTVPAEAVVAAVRTHALIGLDTGGLTQVTVTRAARTIPAKDIEDAVAEALSAQYQLGSVKDVTVTFDRPLQAMYVEPTALGDASVSRIAYDPRSMRFDAEIDLPTGASSRGTLRLTGRATATTEVVTVAHTVERGNVIKASDVALERRPRAEIGREPVTDPDVAIGMAARANLQAGRILHTTDVAKPDLVQRNETVTLTYEMPGIALTVRGKALENGAQGDVIAVQNEQSKRTLQGTVIGPGRVAIGTGTARLAANLAAGARR